LKLICFDCDSTLSSIEGIDELARLRGADVHRRVEAMTRDAMGGTTPLEEVFGSRLEAIRPGAAELDEVARMYVTHVEPTAVATVGALAKAGWTAAIISAGFSRAIAPLAALVGISRVEAVEIRLAPEGAYLGYDAGFPTTRTGGKREVIDRLRAHLRPERVVMVGDGVSDLEAAPSVDLFIGFGGFVTREKVRREAARFVTSLAAIPPLLG
jgi:phosphoserine phosphatase